MTESTNCRRPHICLTGGWFSSSNIGDQAVLLGVTDAFSSLGDPRFSVITANPAKVRAEHNLPAFAPKKSPLALLNNLAGADALVFTGGTPFYDAKPHMSYYTALAALAHARGIPVVVFGISLRTLNSRYCRLLMQRVAGWADFLGAREDRTLQRFSQLAEPAKVHLVPDVAVQLVPSTVERAEELLQSAGVDPGARRVSICLRDFRADRRFQRHHYSRAYEPASLVRYHDTVRQIIEHAVRRHDCQIVLCPMHTIAPDDDRRLAEEIRNSVADAGIRRRIVPLVQQHGPRDMKAMLGRMDANVGVRFHSLVLATSMHVPSIALAYAHKNHAWMNYIGMPTYAHDLATLSASPLCDQLDATLAEREALQAQLQARYAQIHQHFRHQLDAAWRIIWPSGASSAPCDAASPSGEQRQASGRAA